jgi:hypothetical protein
MIKVNTKKEDLKFAIAMFKEDCLKGIKLTPKQKHAFDYFISNLNQLCK